MLNMNDEEILQDFVAARNLKPISGSAYRYTIKVYTEFHQMTMQELIDEAETEEEQGIRWKHRKLKRRLIDFRNYINEQYLENTAKNHFNKILAIYRHHEIEIHDLPTVSRKNIRVATPINFKDLPDKEIIKQGLKVANPLMRAIILLMSSSGCARREVINLTIKDFLEATKSYHGKEDIYEAINVMKDREDIIPMFHIKRQKTNKFYYTFCSPEAAKEIINYLISRKKHLTNEDKLFKIHTVYLNNHFQDINNTLNLGKRGTFIRFRSHMLRKFHASQLYNDGVPLEIVDSLQGRGKDSTHSSYFMEDPEKLKQIFIEHLNAVTINLDINNLDLKSPEYVKMETELENKEVEVSEMKKSFDLTIKDILKRVDSLERDNLEKQDLMKFKRNI